MSPGAWTVVVAVALVCAVGLARALRDGRFRGTHRVRGAAADPDDSPSAAAQSPVLAALREAGLSDPLGERATLLQLSSAFCAPCRATRRVLADVAGVVPGVVHREVDAEHHLDLVRALGVLRTPTTLVLDRHGHEVSRAQGALRKEQVLAALAAAVPDPP